MARYYRSAAGANARVSAEITGYALSTFLYLDAIFTGDEYEAAARRTAEYLTGPAWSNVCQTYPFELTQPGEPSHAYFFDCGIIARGLIAAWRRLGNPLFLERARACCQSMALDFAAERGVHPIIELPSKKPLAYEPRWSREPGCYQLKSAVAWRELAGETEEPEGGAAFRRMADEALAAEAQFFAQSGDATAEMDRLHPYCYFLEALLFDAGRPEADRVIRQGIAQTAERLRNVAPVFVRSDVYAQLLRIRLFADAMRIAPLDAAAAREEAAVLAAFQAGSGGQRLQGGFYFGRRHGEWMPFVNPVSTAFGLQALRMWHEYRNGGVTTPLRALI